MATQIRGNTQIIAGSIYDAQIAATAAIATTKLADGANFLKRDGSVALTGDLNAGTHKIISLAIPTADTDAANKLYVDNLVGNGLAIKDAVRFKTTSDPITLSGLGVQVDAGDWTAPLTAGDRILVDNLADTTQNGIYIAAVGAWTRASDFNSALNIKPNSFFFVSEGTKFADTGWVMVTDAPIVVDTSELLFMQFSSAGVIVPGDYLSKSGVMLNVRAGAGLGNDGSNNLTITLADSSLFVDGTGLRLADLPAAQVLVGSAADKATPVTLTGDISINDTGVVAVAATVAKYANFVYSEVPTGLINGANTSFALASTPKAGTARVYMNGVRQQAGAGNDYTISGSTITYLAAPLTGDILLVDYVN